MRRVITPAEFQGKETVPLARSLLGKMLVRTTTEGRIAGRITEVEAYVGEKDLACHASKGRTQRTNVLYQSGGRWYVYLCYGIHEMLNLVTGPENHPAAILIRGVEGMIGPGRLTRHLHIDRTLNGHVAVPAAGLHLEDDGFRPPRGSIRSGPRVGVDYAGPRWAAKPWRFWIEADKLPRKSASSE